MTSEKNERLTVKAVTPSGADAYVLRLLGADGCVSYSLFREDYVALGAPAVGDILTAFDVEELALSAQRHLAVCRAYRILEAGENTRRQLRQKLLLRGIDRESADFAVSYMDARGYIREREQAYRLAVQYSRYKYWGKAKIVAHLTAKGYDRADILSAIKEAEDDGEIDFEAAFERLAEKKLGEKPPPAELCALRYKYGYK